MAIQTVGSLQEILSNYDAKKWTKSADLEGKIASTEWANDLKSPLVDEGPKKIKSFGEFLSDSIADVNNLQVQANESIQRLVTGENKNIHETMLAVEQAEIAFKTMNQIRQKVLDAYREVMKMQV